MTSSKKILSVLLVVILCLSAMMVSSVPSSADIEPLTAYRFETANYDASLASNDPTYVKANNAGAVNIVSDHIQHQYQMNFKVTDQQAMKAAIEETCEYYDGFLSVNIAVNEALTSYGSACRPTVSVSLMANANGERIATTGENSLYSEQAGQFILDVSRFMEEEYVNQIKYVYVQIQCYNWGCGGGLGTQPNVTVYPIKVYTGDMSDDDIPTIQTKEPDPNQTTFLNFSPKAKIDDNNAPETIHYSGDGVTWRTGAFAKEENYGYTRFTQQLNSREQVQTAFGIEQMGGAAADALNLARMGSGYLKLDVTLQECKNMKGEPTIAEVSIGINTKEGNDGTNPGLVRVTAWQYPGTTRTYYLDISKITHISQVNSVVITVQNYWYYRAGTREMFDWNVESGYGGKENAEALGHEKCEIKPIIVVSPITVYKGDKEVVNTAYDLVLDDFNQNGGVVPEEITVYDPNCDNGNDPESPDQSESTTVGGGTTASGGDNVTTVTLPNGEHTHKYAWVVTKKATYFAKGKESFKCIYCEDVSRVETIKKKVLAAPKVTAKKSGNKIKITYKKVKNASGFQVRYRKSGKWKLQKFKTKKKATRYTKAVAAGNYTVQVRAYITKGKKTAYGKWSAVKKVKI